jgi:hypothetical protein
LAAIHRWSAGEVFDTQYSGDCYSYDLTPDGRRFLMTKEATPGDRSHPPEMVVVLNWFEDVTARPQTR